MNSKFEKTGLALCVSGFASLLRPAVASWLPEGPGYQLFSTIPRGAFRLATHAHTHTHTPPHETCQRQFTLRIE